MMKKNDGELTVLLAQNQTLDMPPCAAAAPQVLPPLMMSLLTAANHPSPFVPVGKVGLRHHLNGLVLLLLGVTERARDRGRGSSRCQTFESGEPVTVAAWDQLLDHRTQQAWRDQRGLLGVFAALLLCWKHPS